MERLSTQTQESGFVSMHSQRSSSQSYTSTAAATTNLVSKRSSQQSSLSYNSQSVQSFSQHQRLSAGETTTTTSNGSVVSHKTTSMTSSRSVHSASNIGADPSFMEKLVYVGVAWFFMLSFILIDDLFVFF